MNNAFLSFRLAFSRWAFFTVSAAAVTFDEQNAVSKICSVFKCQLLDCERGKKGSSVLFISCFSALSDFVCRSQVGQVVVLTPAIRELSSCIGVWWLRVFLCVFLPQKHEWNIKFPEVPRIEQTHVELRHQGWKTSFTHRLSWCYVTAISNEN